MEIVFIVSFVVLALLITLFVWYYFFGEMGEIKKASKEFEIFGLKEGFVPQGITYVKKQGLFLISGYVSKKYEPSRIYVVDEKTKQCVKYVTLKFASGKFYFGCAGGIANHNDSCFLVGEGRVYRFLTTDVFDAKNGDALRIVDSFETFNNADFCFVYDSYLWVGEFYKLGKSKTDVTHHVLNDDGVCSHALAFGFKLSNCVTCGVENKLPEKALSLPDIVQGISVSGKTIYVSCSYAVAKSTIYEYENVLLKKPSKKFVIDDRNIDLWELSSNVLKKTRVLPEMAEEIEFANGKLYVLFESAANKYKIVTRTRINHVFSIK